MTKVTRAEISAKKPVVIQNFVVARPPRRTNFDIADWRNALTFAELKETPNRVLLYDLYEDIRLDPHLARQWEKRVENITNTQWIFTVKDKDKPELAELIDTPAFEEILKEIMETIAWGITLIELGLEGKTLFGVDENVLSVYSVDRKHIHPLTGTIVKEQYDSAQLKATNGIKYREGRYSQYVGEIGRKKDLGLLLNIAPYVILKKGGVSDWATFVQLFGQPFREYRYDGYDDTVRVMLEKSAQEMGSAPYIILPDGSQLTIHDLKHNNTGEVHSKLVAYCDKMISIRILGNTLTTDNSNVGSNALGEVHAATQDEVYASDKKMVRRVLNNIVRPILYNLGFDVKDGFFHPKEEKDLKRVLDRLKVLQMVKSLGAPVDDDTIYQDSDVPKPDNYEELKAQQEAEADALDDDNGIRPGGSAGKKNKGRAKLSFAVRKFLADFFDPAP